ncbi:myelin-oligodendrocyte glycoprotein-like [Etheostoma cragini]|uniref:myelin-oligodendrocyte glycoprotein-like n=1 Tax=Etheostoma cragini TaxID=417921 RepID=UPI00155E6CD0|nr:myelin-oligodendrocyte glycoprotein-like [Etheostoma cragini]
MEVEKLSCSVSLSPVILHSTLVVILLIVGFAAVEGDSHVVGPVQPIVAAPGDDVILPCHVEPPETVAGMTVEWSRPDRQPDPRDRLSRVEYVHLYRDTREVPDMKISSYVGRTELFTEGLRHGNISLKIMNVTLADRGRFRCFIPKLHGQTQWSVVQLVVEQKSPTTETPLQPRSHQTSHPRKEANGKGDLSRQNIMIPVVVVCVVFLMILGVGVIRYSPQGVTRCQKHKLILVPTV